MSLSGNIVPYFPGIYKRFFGFFCKFTILINSSQICALVMAGLTRGTPREISIRQRGNCILERLLEGFLLFCDRGGKRLLIEKYRAKIVSDLFAPDRIAKVE